MRRGAWIVTGLAVALVIAVGATFPLWRPILFDDVVDEAFPAAEVQTDGSEVNVVSDADDVAAAEATGAAMPDDESDEPMPASAPSALRVADFGATETMYPSEGTATIYQLEDGSHVLRLEDFSISNGPALHVLLSPSANPDTQESLGEYIDLGRLKGNVGSSNYDIPADVDISQYQSVVIYCMPFHVTFAAAPLQTANVSAAPDSDIRLMSFQQPTATPDVAVTEEATEEAPSEPVPLFTGTFEGAGRFYEGTGSATFYEEIDGSTALRLEDGFSVTRGPELFVFLVNTDDPLDPSTFGEDAVNIAPLRSFGGNQRYRVPEDLDITQFTHVLIYCEPYEEVFSYAPIAPVADEAVALTGSFAPVGTSYDGGGAVSIQPNDDGTATLTLADDFTVSSGPDLFVVLSPAENPTRGNELGEFVTLGALTANAGEQTYTIETDVDWSAYNSVVIYCRAFSTIFTAAPLVAEPEETSPS